MNSLAPSNQAVADRLQQYGELIKERQKLLQEKQTNDFRQNAAPKLAPHSASLHREGDIVDRLYNLAAKQRQDKEFTEELSSNTIQHDHITGQRLFEPKISKTSEKIAQKKRDPNVPIEDMLHNRGLEYQMKAKWREQKMQIQAQLIRETSKINPTSEKIVKVREILHGEKTADRLMKPIGTVKPSILEQLPNPTFKPQINKKSIDIVQSSSVPSGVSYHTSPSRSNKESPYFSNQEYPPEANEYLDRQNYFYENREEMYDQGLNIMDLHSIANHDFNDSLETSEPFYTLRPTSPSRSHDFYSLRNSNPSSLTGQDSNDIYKRSQRWANEKAKRLEMERKIKAREIEEQCSFKPNLAENRSFITSSNSSSTVAVMNNEARDIAERQLEWKKKRDQKLEMERKKKEIEEMQDCSFAPNIISKSSQSLHVHNNHSAATSNTSSSSSNVSHHNNNHSSNNSGSSSSSMGSAHSPRSPSASRRTASPSKSSISQSRSAADNSNNSSKNRTSHSSTIDSNRNNTKTQFQGNSNATSNPQSMLDNPTKLVGNNSESQPSQPSITPLSTDPHPSFKFKALQRQSGNSKDSTTELYTVSPSSYLSKDSNPSLKLVGNIGSNISPPIRSNLKMQNYSDEDREIMIRNGWDDVDEYHYDNEEPYLAASHETSLDYDHRRFPTNQNYNYNPNNISANSDPNFNPYYQPQRLDYDRGQGFSIDRVQHNQQSFSLPSYHFETYGDSSHSNRKNHYDHNMEEIAFAREYAASLQHQSQHILLTHEHSPKDVPSIPLKEPSVHSPRQIRTTQPNVDIDIQSDFLALKKTTLPKALSMPSSSALSQYPIANQTNHLYATDLSSHLNDMDLNDPIDLVALAYEEDDTYPSFASHLAESIDRPETPPPPPPPPPSLYASLPPYHINKYF